jgi:hypothetical protein
MLGSGLHFNDGFLLDVLREAAEIEQTKGLIRPITINLCGLVLSRFASGLPRGFRPGNLIRGFLRESVMLPPVRQVAPRVVPQLISNNVTKVPRSLAELAAATAISEAEVRGCLRILGHMDRAIVRPLDVNQQRWEISHDFLVPLLDSIVSRWTVSLPRRVRPWLPRFATAIVAAGIVTMSSWRKDPIVQLTELGWTIQRTDKELVLSFEGAPPAESVLALNRIHTPLHVVLNQATIDLCINNVIAYKCSVLRRNSHAPPPR